MSIIMSIYETIAVCCGVKGIQYGMYVYKSVKRKDISRICRLAEDIDTLEFFFFAVVAYVIVTRPVLLGLVGSVV